MLKLQGGFKNFWYYNKIKIIALIALILFVAFAISQCSFGESADFGILHVSEARDVRGDAFVAKLKEDSDLIFKNEEPDVDFISVYVPSNPKDIMETGVLEKIQLELVGGSCTLFILDEETVYSYQNDELFYDLTDIADEYSIPPEARYIGPNGEVLAISVDGNAYLDECSLQSDALYIAIRAHSKDDAGLYQNAFSAIRTIISNR